jgi:hypothetical protein
MNIQKNPNNELITIKTISRIIPTVLFFLCRETKPTSIVKRSKTGIMICNINIPVKGKKKIMNNGMPQVKKSSRAKKAEIECPE